MLSSEYILNRASKGSSGRGITIYIFNLQVFIWGRPEIYHFPGLALRGEVNLLRTPLLTMVAPHQRVWAWKWDGQRYLPDLGISKCTSKAFNIKKSQTVNIIVFVGCRLKETFSHCQFPIPRAHTCQYAVKVQLFWCIWSILATALPCAKNGIWVKIYHVNRWVIIDKLHQW